MSVAAAPRVAAVPARTVETADDQTSREWSADRFGPKDVFDLEWVYDPQISPDGKRVVYVRRSFDIMEDRVRSNLWAIDADGRNHRPLVSGPESVSSPRFSPDGQRLLYASASRGKTQLFVRWLDSGQTALLTNVTQAPRSAVWSPDGSQIALVMTVEAKSKPMVKMPAAPKGAEWAKPAKVVDQMTYRIDGRGYVAEGYSHLFLVPAQGGTPRQLTTGNFNHSNPAWSADGQTLIVSGNRDPDWEFKPQNSELYAVDVISAQVKALTSRDGVDAGPAVSPDGKRIAYVGFDDEKLGHHQTKAYVMNVDGSDVRELTTDLDREVSDLQWSSDGRSLYFQYSDRGNGKVARVSLDRKISPLVDDVGGTTLGRPYGSGSYRVAKDGTLVFTQTRPEHPADLVLRDRSGEMRTLVRLNDDLFSYKTLATVEDMSVTSKDGLEIQSWIAKPPGFDPAKKYPMILEIHGGPFADYGDRFSAEVQLYASAGYVVLYVNPRGSTSYGREFAEKIHHAYPSQDFDDLMASVDALVQKGYVDPERLFVTGGSGGGTLTAWIVGKTDRFRAAVVAKPVINWASFVLYADFSAYFSQYWFPGMPWDHYEHYWKRSPLSLVGNVKTPTMLLTGESDYRTPIPESEQYYQALKLLKVDTALIRIPDASHGIASRPSQLITKALHVLAWFDRYDRAEPPTVPPTSETSGG